MKRAKERDFICESHNGRFRVIETNAAKKGRGEKENKKRKQKEKRKVVVVHIKVEYFSKNAAYPMWRQSTK